jgi:hypothetical protein
MRGGDDSLGKNYLDTIYWFELGLDNVKAAGHKRGELGGR